MKILTLVSEIFLLSDLEACYLGKFDSGIYSVVKTEGIGNKHTWAETLVLFLRNNGLVFTGVSLFSKGEDHPSNDGVTIKNTLWGNCFMTSTSLALSLSCNVYLFLFMLMFILFGFFKLDLLPGLCYSYASSSSFCEGGTSLFCLSF